MISFVWSAKYPFFAGAGGSENYTAGQIRELIRRGIPARIITIGRGENDGREGFPDITFKSIETKEELSELDDTLIFITYPLDVPTKHPSYAILHCPPPNFARGDSLYKRASFKSKTLIATSKFSARLWRSYIGAFTHSVRVVYPFAEKDFARVVRPSKPDGEPTKVLFAGRLTPDKGIYTLLAALHMEHLAGPDYQVTVTSAGSHADEGKIIYPMLKAHPLLNVVPAMRNTVEMARLMAEHDVVVMPSTNIFWQEMFGIVSVEAQHAGCRVVASRSGGLRETNLGGVLLVKPDDPEALAAGVARAIKLGPLTAKEREKAARHFTVTESVDALLRIINGGKYTMPHTAPLRKGAEILSRSYRPLQNYSGRLKGSSRLAGQLANTQQSRLKS